jgi:hypothetical protein
MNLSSVLCLRPLAVVQNGMLDKLKRIFLLLAASSGSCSNAGQIETNFSSVFWLRPLSASSGKTLGYKGASRGFNTDLGALDSNSARFLITNSDLGVLDSPTKTLQKMYQLLFSPFIEPY